MKNGRTQVTWLNKLEIKLFSLKELQEIAIISLTLRKLSRNNT